MKPMKKRLLSLLLTMPFGIAFLFELCYTAFSTGAISLSKRL